VSNQNNEFTPSVSNVQLMLAYVTDLELEVDRLRTQSRFIQHEVRATLKGIQRLCKDAAAGTGPLTEIDQAAKKLRAVLRDLHETPGYHPAHDQVIAIAVRPLVEQVFRWQQRLSGAPDAVLRLDLKSQHLEWFPARFRHILDNLIANALKQRDAGKPEAWVSVGLCPTAGGCELKISDNGVGLPPDDRAGVFELLHRTGPARESSLGVGPAIVKLLVEQSGGTLTVTSVGGEGTTFVALLPHYDVDDYLA
jgi:signal transduction histidine kinase